VRLAGPVAAARDLGSHDHVCWTYDACDDLRDVFVEFLEAGLASGERVAVTAHDEGELHDLVAALPGGEARVADRSLVLLPLAGVYDGGPVDPLRQVSVYADHTRRALSEGFSGFRIAAEATPLIQEAERRQAFVRYEQLVDHYMAREPFAAMCAYDRSALEADEVTEVACVHPAVRGDEQPPFHLFARDSSTSAIVGEVDAFSGEVFERVLSALPAAVEALDVAALGFIDHRGLLALEREAAERGGLRLVRARRAVRRLHGLLGLRHLEVDG
jgi:hypothetical protein